MRIDQLLVATTGVVKLLIYDAQSLLEFTLVIGSIFIHFLEARQNIWSKVLALPIALMSIYVYLARQLYGKVLHSIISIFFNLYAYVKWKGILYHKPVQLSRTPYKMLLSITGMSILGSIGWGFVTDSYLHKSLSLSTYGDACYLFFGFMDKWLMSHKKLERWMISFLRYMIFSWACYQKGAIILSIHYLILSGIAIYGQIQWYISYKTIKI